MITEVDILLEEDPQQPKYEGQLSALQEYWRISEQWFSGASSASGKYTVHEALVRLRAIYGDLRYNVALRYRAKQLSEDIVVNQDDNAATLDFVVTLP